MQTRRLPHCRNRSKLVTGLALGLMGGLVVFALLCPVIAPDIAHGEQSMCLLHTSWLLVAPVSPAFVVIGLWLSCLSRRLRLPEYVPLVFRPPRARSHRNLTIIISQSPMMKG